MILPESTAEVSLAAGSGIATRACTAMGEVGSYDG